MRHAVALRRSLSVAHVLFVVTTAYAGALVVGAVSALWLEGEAPRLATPSSEPDVSPMASESAGPTDVSIIFRRNLFGSEPIEVAETASPTAPASTDLTLRGTATLDGRGFAVIHDKDSNRQEVFAVGEQVFDGPRLVAVTDTRAVLMGAGTKHTIEITEAPAGDAPAGKTTPQAAGEAASGIRKTGATSFAVDRRAVEHSIDNMSSIVTQMRAVPFLRDGKSQGFRVFNIRSGSIFESMGLKNGDVIQAVNGVDLNDPTKALSLVDEIATVDQIRIDLLRNNKPTTFTYSVQ